MEVLKHARNVSVILSTLSLFGCGGSVSDTWPGIGELRIENNGARFSDDSFGLGSDLVLSGLTPDTSFSITSNCHRRARLESELPFEQHMYSKTIDYSANEEILSSVPIINLIDERVLIYPDLFEQCSFIVEAQNSVGSTDRETLYAVNFDYSESDHQLTLDDSEVESDLREGLYESRSRLKAIYTGDIEHPTTSINPTIVVRAVPEPRINDPKLLCYTNDFKETSVNLELDLNNSATEILNFYNLARLHEVTSGRPMENCIFIATDKTDRIVSSKPFDLIRDINYINTTFWYDNLQVLPELTSQPLEFTSRSEVETPELPEQLLSINYYNTSNEEKLVLLGSRSTFSGNGNVFLFKKQTAQNTTGDRVVYEQGCLTDGPIYRHRYFRLERTEIPSQFRWGSEHLKYIGDKVFLAVPAQSSGILSLNLEIDESVFTFHDVSEYDGIIIAPFRDLESVGVSFASPNEFRINVIEQNGMDEVFFNGVRYSSLPQGFRNPEDELLSSQSAFGIVLFNRHQDSSDQLNVREDTYLGSEQACFRNSQPSIIFNSDGVQGTYAE